MKRNTYITSTAEKERENDNVKKFLLTKKTRGTWIWFIFDLVIGCNIIWHYFCFTSLFESMIYVQLICRQKLFCSLRSYQHSSDKMKISNDQNPLAVARSVSCVQHLWRPCLIHRVKTGAGSLFKISSDQDQMYLRSNEQLEGSECLCYYYNSQLCIIFSTTLLGQQSRQLNRVR